MTGKKATENQLSYIGYLVESTSLEVYQNIMRRYKFNLEDLTFGQAGLIIRDLKRVLESKNSS